MSIYEWRHYYDVDPDFLEHVHRETCRQGELPWDA